MESGSERPEQRLFNEHCLSLCLFADGFEIRHERFADSLGAMVFMQPACRKGGYGERD